MSYTDPIAKSYEFFVMWTLKQMNMQCTTSTKLYCWITMYIQNLAPTAPLIILSHLWMKGVVHICSVRLPQSNASRISLLAGAKHFSPSPKDTSLKRFRSGYTRTYGQWCGTQHSNHRPEINESVMLLLHSSNAKTLRHVAGTNIMVLPTVVLLRCLSIHSCACQHKLMRPFTAP